MRWIPKMYIALALFVCVGVGLYVMWPHQRVSSEIARSYHQSQFFRYSEFIESSLREADSAARIDLDTIVGGIVPHHIPTTISLLAEFYTKLKNTRDVKTFVILAPDHVDMGRGNISVSQADFIMPFGTLRPDVAMIEQFEASDFVVQDEAPFDREHSIDSQVLLISRLFPNARIVPLIFRSSITNEEARAFGKVLAQVVDEDTFVVSSVDFSHYLSERQARPLDYLSANVLSAIDSQQTDFIDADSEQALVAFMSFLETRGANHSVDLHVFNTSDFNRKNDYTTGYVTGFWGIKYSASRKLDDSRPVTLLFVGDIMLSRYIGDIMKRNNDWRYPFLEVADVLKNADIAFGNLEGPISTRGAKTGSAYSFRADPRVIEGLEYAGFDVLSIANNHIWDYGADAVIDTISGLKKVGMSVVGGGQNYTETHQPSVKEVGNTRIAFLGYTDLISSALDSKTAKPAVAFLDLKQAIADIQEARNSADVVVVSLHWGNEYETNPNDEQEGIGHDLINAGANLIIGHHPHVVQSVEEYSGGYIAYSLGNFVFDQNFSPQTETGLMLKITLRDKKISKIEQIKIEFTSSYQPFLLD